MEAPPLSTARPAAPTTTTTPLPPPYQDSVASSPRCGKNDSWDADPPPLAKLRLMCSYGGHIVPRPHDKTLCYIGGDTRIIVIQRHTSLSDLHHRLSKTLFSNQPFSLKYQLPTEDLDSLITVTSDEELENMLEEHDRLHNVSPLKPGRLRLFLFPKSSLSIDQIDGKASSRRDDWFFDALNGKSSNSFAGGGDCSFSESSSINNLLGLDDEIVGKPAEKDVELKVEGWKIRGVANGNARGSYVIHQDLHSVLDCPMLDTTSSFGSASSSPSIANVPPIRVHVEENRNFSAGLGIEEQFQQMSVGVVRDVNPPRQKQEEEGVFVAAAGTVPVIFGGESRIISHDERSDHGGQNIQQQQKQTNAFDLPSPDSISTDGSVAYPLYRQQRQSIYHHEPSAQIQSGNSIASSNQMDLKTADLKESGHVYDQIQHPEKQFIHAGHHYHYIPNNAVPISVYQHDQHYPVYFKVSGRQTQAYNFHEQQRNYNELSQNEAGMVNGVYRSAGRSQSSQHQPQYIFADPSRIHPFGT